MEQREDGEAGTDFGCKVESREAAPELALRRTGLVDHLTREMVMAKREMSRLARLGRMRGWLAEDLELMRRRPTSFPA